MSAPNAEPLPPGRMTRPVLVSETAAADWENALISGNGRQGALVYGAGGAVLVTLSHERLFLPVDEPLPAPGTAAILPELRASLLAGRYQEAADEVVRFAQEEEPGYRKGRNSDPFVGAATLSFHSDETAGHCDEAVEHGDYQRRTDFGTGLVTQRWRTASGELRHELFVSRADDVVVTRLTGPVTGCLRLAPIEGTPPVTIETSVAADAGSLVLTAHFPDRWPGGTRGYEVACRIVAPAGTVSVDRGELRIAGADDLLLIARVRLLDDPPSALEEMEADFAALLARHTALHGSLFGGSIWISAAPASRCRALRSCSRRSPAPRPPSGSSTRADTR